MRVVWDGERWGGLRWGGVGWGEVVLGGVGLCTVCVVRGSWWRTIHGIWCAVYSRLVLLLALSRVCCCFVTCPCLLSAHCPLHDPLSAFPISSLFSQSGDLIAATCGDDRIVTKETKQLTHATNSTCRVVRETYKWLVASGWVEQERAFSEGSIDGTAYIIGMQRIVTARGHLTPYYIAQSYPVSRSSPPPPPPLPHAFLFGCKG